MKFRSLALAAALALGLPLAAQAQQKVTLKFHTFVTNTSNVYKGALVPWMERIEKDSGGRIVFEKYPSMQLGGSPLQLYDQAKDGVVDVVWTLAGNTPGRFPRVEVFELPFMMTNAEATSRAYWEYSQTCGSGEFQDVQLLALHVHGPGMFHSKDKPIRSVADLKGMKVRGPTRQTTKLLSAIGATPVGMPLPQIPDALSKGVVEAVVVPWEITPSIKVDELAKHHSEFDAKIGGLYTVAFVVAMNKAKYNSLPPDLKAIIDKHSGIDASGALGRDHQAGDPLGRTAAVDRKNNIVTIGGAELEGFRKAADLVDDDWVKEVTGKGLNGQGLLTCAKDLIKKHTR
jgi:hypothetical protein